MKVYILIGEVYKYFWCKFNCNMYFSSSIRCVWEFKGGIVNFFGEIEGGFNKGYGFELGI